MQMFQTFRNACIALVQKDAIAEVRSAVKLLPLHIPKLITHICTLISIKRAGFWWRCAKTKTVRMTQDCTVLIELDDSLSTLSSNSYI